MEGGRMRKELENAFGGKSHREARPWGGKKKIEVLIKGGSIIS